MTRIYGLLAICFLIADPVLADTRIPQEELPDAIISFAYSFSYGSGRVKEKSESDGTLIEEYYNNIVDMLAGQDDDFYMELLFADNFCKIQSGDPGHFCGHTEKILPHPRAGFVYVTTPIKETGGTVFLIVSSVSPEQTRILSFEEGAPARLLYNSLSKGDFCTTKGKNNYPYSPIRSIYHIAVVEPGVFVLRESGNVPEYEGETKIILSLLDRKCSMVVEEVRSHTLDVPRRGAPFVDFR